MVSSSDDVGPCMQLEMFGNGPTLAQSIDAFKAYVLARAESRRVECCLLVRLEGVEVRIRLRRNE